MGTLPFDISSLNESTLIGQGNYDVKVYLARHKKTDDVYAVKTFNLETSEICFKVIQHEIFMHKELKHKNILPMINSFAVSHNVYLVTPLMGFGSCRDIIQAHFNTGFPELAIAYILKDILSAVDYLHSRHVIHRSIKGSHILIGSNGNVMLSGLRHCYSMLLYGSRLKSVHDFPQHYVSSLNWASRELLEQNLAGYGTKSDMYSIGILSCELGNGVVPFFNLPMTQMLLHKIDGHTPLLIDVTTYSQVNSKKGSEENDLPDAGKKTFSSHFHNFVKLCLNYDPKARPSASSLESHWFFKQTRSKNQPNLLTLLRPLVPTSSKNVKTPVDPVDIPGKKLEKLKIKEMEWNF